MFIKNQKFSDEETLLEQLFDFGLGDPSPEVKTMMTEIDQEVLHHKEFQEYKKTLTDEEEIMELDEEERRIRLAERLMTQYDHFEVFKQQLFGVRNENKTLLYSIDLY